MPTTKSIYVCKLKKRPKYSKSSFTIQHLLAVSIVGPSCNKLDQNDNSEILSPFPWPLYDISWISIPAWYKVPFTIVEDVFSVHKQTTQQSVCGGFLHGNSCGSGLGTQARIRIRIRWNANSLRIGSDSGGMLIAMLAMLIATSNEVKWD